MLQRLGKGGGQLAFSVSLSALLLSNLAPAIAHGSDDASSSLGTPFNGIMRPTPAAMELQQSPAGHQPATTDGADNNAASSASGDVDNSQDQSSWSLPMLGQMNNASSHANNQGLSLVKRAIVAPKVPEKLEGNISSADPSAQAGSALDRLLQAALDRDPQTKILDTAVHHYRTKTQMAIAESKDATDYMINYRGFGPSSEAGDVILDEKVKLKSRASSEFARQKHIDETHLKIVTNMMQLAMGLGMSDAERGQQVAETGFQALKDLVGEDEAVKARQTLLSWTNDANIPESIYKKSVWDVNQKQEKQTLIVETSLEEDPVVKEIKRRLHKYNQHSTLGMASSHVIQATLGSASTTPTFVGPAAKFALLSYIMATGGPEQVKIMKELYLDKRFESRAKVVSEEAHLVLDNYQVALLTHNPVLLTCSQSVLGQMVPADAVEEVFGDNIVSGRPDPGA